MKSEKHKVVRAAYLFYYATETAFSSDSPSSSSSSSAVASSSSARAPPAGSNSLLRERLNSLINDALILAKKVKFDVFNALTLLDNALFLEQQKFGAGDGSLHYYLFNYKAHAIAGGVDAKNRIDESGSGVGVVML